MHEQIHNQTEAATDESILNVEQPIQEPRKNPVSTERDDFIKQISEPMQEYALANAHLTHSAHFEGIKTGDFSKFIAIQKTVYLHVILTISPAENEVDAPFWHCSMSLVSKETGTPKTIGLWTKGERENIRKLLPSFLGERGLKYTQGFMKTKTALHCHRYLRTEELEMVRGRENGN